VIEEQGGEGIGMRNALAWIVLACLGASSSVPVTAQPSMAPAADGSHGFDFEIGTWRTHVKRLVKPLSGSTTWVEYDGTSVVRELLDGKANLVELSIAGPAGKIEGVSLRLFEPQARRWSINYAGMGDGLLTPPVFGSFKGGRGEFTGKDMLGDRPILVRFVITQISPDTARFEQSFSADDGKSWETNWIATDTRISPDR
jgi:hypothetical protein